MTDSFCHISGGWQSTIKGSTGLITSMGEEGEPRASQLAGGSGWQTLAFFALQIHPPVSYLDMVPPSHLAILPSSYKESIIGFRIHPNPV